MERTSTSRRSAIFMALALTLIPALAAHAQQPPADEITGAWEADDGSVKLSMYKSGSEFQARLLYGNHVMEADNVTFKQDTLNPDPALRTRSLKNIVFLRGLHWDNGEWTGGSLYDGSSGRTYHCKAGIKEGKMLLRGYIGIPALGQTQTFHRTNE